MIVNIKPSKITIETTSKWSKKLAYQIRSSTGADVVINGTLFNYSTWKPVCPTKANGKILCTSTDVYRGLAWNNGEGNFRVALSTDMDKYDNFLSCVFIINNGKSIPYWVDSAVARTSERTAIVGKKDGTISLFCSKTKYTIPNLTSEILKLGNVEWAMMLDGGGSCQLSQTGNSYIYSSRKVHNYVCFWEQDTEPKGEKPMVEINSYSKKTDGSKKLATNFTVKEFACKDGSDAILVAPRLVMVLQSIRSHFKKAVTINSAYRTPQYNTKVGGVDGSQHCYGTAADISISGVTPKEVATYARSIMPDWGGVGIYKEQGFVHVDVRETRSDWNG